MRDGFLYFTMYGRLAEGADAAAAGVQLRAARDALVEEYGREGSLHGSVPVVESGVGVAPWVRQRAETTMGILLGAVALLVLLGCANAANLLLTRSVGRAQELSVRRALGAGRARLAAQLMTEGLLLGLLGGVMGAAVARGALLLYRGERFLAWLPTFDTVPLDGRVLLFAAGVSITTGMLFSLAPALAATRGPTRGFGADRAWRELRAGCARRSWRHRWHSPSRS